MESKTDSCNVSAYQKRKLAKKLDATLKELAKPRKSGDLGAIVAAKACFREVQDEINIAYGEKKIV